MSNIGTIFKGNAPLMHFSFATNGGSIVPLPTSTNKYTVYIHDSAGVRTGAGTISNINTGSGTCDYQSAAADWANAGVTTTWITVDIGEPAVRTFLPQKILVQDPTQS